MTQLLMAREVVKNIVGKYEVYLKPLGKFLLALMTFMMINSKTGYMEKLTPFSIVMIAALLCSFMPMNFMVVLGGLFLVLHFYALSMECAIVMLVLYLLLMLLYFRFSPEDSVLLVLMPLFMGLNIPYLLPICMGLLATPASVVSVACGVVVYYSVNFVAGNATAIDALGTEDMSARFRYLVDGILSNKTMVALAICFAATVIIVYVIRRLSIDHSWTIAIVVGGVAQMLLLLICNLMLDSDISIAGVCIGSVISVLLAKCVEFMMFQLDYTRTEKVQFEDDDYYYYVKAVPKISMSKKKRSVKKINAAQAKARLGEREEN